MGLEVSTATPPTVFNRSQPNFMRTLATMLTMVEHRLLLFWQYAKFIYYILVYLAHS